ncbi:hypothetical protein SCHPADRAFT_907169 [Schizopora paradoxa]|uniref:Ino eighty subunit 1 n=1 Tax=Schizopora paradoxa TaxID=27342 RepID=A0A0H2REX7_9AGAM|nr:hypothetical protein SCHPADRAFT_907169 [Schizopora paradoxa]
MDMTQNQDASGSNIQFSIKKILPIKKSDAEMLTRDDIQFDLLDAIFSDQTKAFTDQTGGKSAGKIAFSQLYINALYQSNKCSKVLKDKMKETPAFAIELAKISLLANVGRINTTMAFFPEMKTALRTYHPVPSLQKTDGNLQDAPRIKNCLKAALLPSEARGSPPTSLGDVIEKLRNGQRPPTSIVNLIFIMSNQTTLLGRQHFNARLDFLDIFMPVNIPSPSRARAFLWLVYHYLEDPFSSGTHASSSSSSRPTADTNPFSDDYAREHPGMVPYLPMLRDDEMRALNENIDPPEEIEWGNQMCAQRTGFLQRLVNNTETEKKIKNVFKPPVVLTLAPATEGRRARAPRQVYEAEGGGETFRHYAPQSTTPRKISNTSTESSSIVSPRVEFIDQPPVRPQRSMLEHAFHIVSTTDPLASSDEEYDEHIALDYDRRLRVLNRLRGRAPTPERAQSPIDRYESRRRRHHPYRFRRASHPRPHRLGSLAATTSRAPSDRDYD